MKNNLTIALPKGRLSKSVFQLLEQAGYKIPNLEDSRKLIIQDSVNGFTYYFVKPTDVPTYVDRGVCDIGISGKDTLIEADKQVYELLDLNIGRCKIVLAGIDKETYQQKEDIVIATKFVRITKEYFDSIKQKVVIVKLNGSVELGPIVNLSDAIIDIYETGSTLKANGLQVFEYIKDISAYLIANKASYRIKNKQIINLIERLKAVI